MRSTRADWAPRCKACVSKRSRPAGFPGSVSGGTGVRGRAVSNQGKGGREERLDPAKGSQTICRTPFVSSCWVCVVCLAWVLPSCRGEFVDDGVGSTRRWGPETGDPWKGMGGWMGQIIHSIVGSRFLALLTLFFPSLFLRISQHFPVPRCLAPDTAPRATSPGVSLPLSHFRGRVAAAPILGGAPVLYSWLVFPHARGPRPPQPGLCLQPSVSSLSFFLVLCNLHMMES
jgi:hypothetical protein